MALKLAEVRDIDCVVSAKPLRLGLTSREVTGVAAVLRRILYRWCTKRGSLTWDAGVGLSTTILDLPGVVFSPQDLAGYQQALRREAVAEDFVADAVVTVVQATGGDITIRALITLVDGRTYALEVSIADAVAALDAIGGT